MADNEFERLLGIVARLNAQLELTRGILNDLSGRPAAQGTSPLRDMVTGMEADIKRMEAVRTQYLAELQRVASANRKVYPLIKRGIDPETARYSQGPGGRGPLDERLSATGYKSTEAIYRMGREVASKMLNQIQNELLKGAIQATARQRAVSNIPNVTPQNNPADYGMPFPDDFGKGPAGSRKYRPASGSWAEWKYNQENPFGDMGGGGKKKVNAAAEAAAKAEEELTNTLRQRLQKEPKYAHWREQAAKLEFDIARDKIRVENQGIGGMEKISISRRDATTGGVARQFDSIVSPSGKATPTISNQFRTFGQGVLRDIGELTKWSLALAAVYGPLNKLKELTQTMIENQSKLAEATISVNSSMLDQAAVFDIAASAADKAGESIGGVIDAFTQAYRATGGSGSQQERLVTANKLLNDSLVLAKLSTLDQASAIDTLSAALRQSGDALGGSNIALQNGTILLDKWVRVTKIANVDLASLATGFAVLGDSAEAAGIDADHLNGIIATISETGISTGKETANIARALVGNFQTDAAEKALNQLGISSKTATGEMRPLLDVMQQISDLRTQGLLDDPTFSKLTQTIGQGVRRGASTATFLENFSRVGEVAQESARAQGDAQAALDKQLATVATSITKLGNAFDKLAQTLGTDSGFLGIITSVLNGITGLVNGFDSLVSLLGKATPAMIAFGAASAFLKYRGISGGVAGQVQGYGASLQSPSYKSGAQFSLPGFGLPNDPSQDKSTRAGRWIGTNVLGTNAMSGAFQGLAMSLAPLLQNAFNKEDRFGGTKAIADAAGGIVGGILGSLAGPGGALVGATIGISIAEAFVNSVTSDRQIYDYAKGPQVVGGLTPGPVVDPEQRLVDAEIQLYKDIGKGSELLGRAATEATMNSAKGVVNEFNALLKEGDTEGARKYIEGPLGTGKLLNQAGITNAQLYEAISGTKRTADGGVDYKQIDFKPESILLDQPEVKEATKQAYLDALKALNETGQGEAGTLSAFSQQQLVNKDNFSKLLKEITDATARDISNRRISGDLKGTEYAKQTSALKGFDEAALQLYTGFGEEFIKIDKNVNSAADAFNVFKNVIVKGAPESVNELIAINTEIGDIINKLADPALKGDKTFNLNGKDYTRASAMELLEKDRATAANLTTDINREVLVRDLQSKIPNVQGDLTKPLQKSELEIVKQDTRQAMESLYKDYLGFSDTEYQAITESFEAWAQIIEESGEVFFEKVEGLDPQLFAQNFQKAMEEGKLKSQKQDVFGIQQVDLPGSQADALRREIKNQEAYLAKNFPQYKQKPEDLGIIFNDYVTAVLHGDNLAVKLALEKLVDINQKQLDGQYNIPEGATFWVPLTAAYYRNKGGDGENMDSGTAANTSATEQNTAAITGLTLALAREASTKYAAGFEAKAATMNDKLEASGILSKEPVSKYYQSEKFGAPVLPYDPAKDPNSKYMRSEKFGTQEAPQAPSFLEKLLQGLMTGFRGVMGGTTVLGGQNLQSPQSLRSGAGMGQANANPAPVSKLDLKISSNTVLNLDGRILANAMQSYLAQDLIRTDATQGTVTKKYVI